MAGSNSLSHHLTPLLIIGTLIAVPEFDRVTVNRIGPRCLGLGRLIVRRRCAHKEWSFVVFGMAMQSMTCKQVDFDWRKQAAPDCDKTIASFVVAIERGARVFPIGLAQTGDKNAGVLSAKIEFWEIATKLTSSLEKLRAHRETSTPSEPTKPIPRVSCTPGWSGVDFPCVANCKNAEGSFGRPRPPEGPNEATTTSARQIASFLPLGNNAGFHLKRSRRYAAGGKRHPHLPKGERESRHPSPITTHNSPLT